MAYSIIPVGMSIEEFETAQKRKTTYNDLLNNICLELQQRDLKEMPTKELLSLARILGKSLSKLES